MQIGRKLYYELKTGNIIIDTGERSGSVIETTEEQDFAVYAALLEHEAAMVGMIQLDYGQNAVEFATCIGYRVDPDTRKVLFSYHDSKESELPIGVESF